MTQIRAMAESFFVSLDCELLKRTVLPTKSAARTALFSYIEGWPNLKRRPRRRHRLIGMMAPNAFKAEARKNQKREVEKTRCDFDGLSTGQGRE